MKLLCTKCNKIDKESYFAKNKNGKRISICIECFNKTSYLPKQQVPKKKKYKYKRETNSKDIYNRYKYSAKNRNLIFDISYNDFMEYWNKSCTYCNSTIKTIGLDRIDSNEGYLISNITPCCWKCNNMKSNMSLEDFKSHIAKLYNRLHLF